jgi:PTH1 family peptidyl-tRNA hydrolase
MTAEINIAGKKLTLMKPLTYMNLSGKAVAAWRAKNGGEPGEMLAISDDIHLDMGQLRLRPGGSHGGQKGLLSLINSLGTLDFPRLRIGIRPTGGSVADMVSYVLARVRPADRAAFEQSWDDAADCIEEIVKVGLEPAMNRYNRKNA